MYSHRSTVLHATAATRQDALNIHADSVILPVVPMFHVNAWGTPYASPTAHREAETAKAHRG